MSTTQFEFACKRIEESVQKYIAKHEIQAEDEDEEEEENTLHKTEIIDKIFKGYECVEDSGRLQHHLDEALRNGAIVCLICIENVKRNDNIWSCEGCYCNFHLDCIQKWAKDSIFLQSQAEEDGNMGGSFRQRKVANDFKWFCPKCRCDYPKSKIPLDYKCFCGKKKNPPFDPWLLPHSCGEKCNRALQPACGHSCLLLCHPGPCPPCPVMVRHPCHCPKAATQMRRCCNKAWSCNAICNRVLLCNQHKCQNRCHAGPCPTCNRTSQQKCQCGCSSEIRPCSDLVWQCTKVCGRDFACKNHKCEQICHKGPCGDCPFGGERWCPCGKKKHNLPCNETVPTCGDTCSRPLSCDVHFCAERCHRGACPQCLQVRVKKCKCGAKEKEMPCSKQFTCEIKCKRLRDCGKHACNRKCCVGDCPMCEHPCGKTLKCGQHKCESRCHRTRCYPCTITHKISCPCGGTWITVPCGRERKTPPPKCSIRCKKESVCHHPEPEKHLCHDGACPPCKRECRILLKCKHTCPATCHDAVPVKVVSQQKRAGPWEKITSYTQIKKFPCPPCLVKVPNICYGKHETSMWACSELRPYACDRKCGRDLSCSHHKCQKECHVVEGASDERSQGANCKSCSRPCSQPRPPDCRHKCKLACHPGSCPTCSENLKMQCHCGILQVTIECQKWGSADAQTREKIRSCTSQCSKELSCKHRCQKECHSGSCTSVDECQKKVGVRCPCKRIRKDFMCCVLSAGRMVLHCDNVCETKAREKRKTKEEAEMKQKLKEEEEQRKELEEYERFVLGKKRIRRKEAPLEQKKAVPFWRTKAFLGSFGVLAISVIVYVVFHSMAGQ